jgi:hypothetical protein
MKVFVLNDPDFCLEALYINSTNGVEVIHDELRFVICTQDFLFDGDALQFHGCMLFDNVKAIVGRFDSFDLQEFSVNICLYIWMHEFENFLEERMAIGDDFV